MKLAQQSSSLAWGVLGSSGGMGLLIKRQLSVLKMSGVIICLLTFWVRPGIAWLPCESYLVLSHGTFGMLKSSGRGRVPLKRESEVVTVTVPSL